MRVDFLLSKGKFQSSPGARAKTISVESEYLELIAFFKQYFARKKMVVSISTKPGTSREEVDFSSSDDWDLIRIIAYQLASQGEDSREQVRELVENALDAFSRLSFSPPEGKRIKITIRKKDKHNSYIRIHDNGPGWAPHQASGDALQGLPDFEYTVTHIGDSIKKKSVEYQRAREEGRAWGHAATGLFSFWTLGERLTVYSRSVLQNGETGPCSMMVWHKEIRNATISHNVDPPSELLSNPGSVVIIDALQETQMNAITGNLLCTYLARSCRMILMKNPDIELSIDDQGRSFFVKPTKLEGAKFKFFMIANGISEKLKRFAKDQFIAM